MGATASLRNQILDKVLRNEDFTVTEVYLSLHTAEPDDTGSNEVSGGSYARQGPVTFDPGSNGESDNANAIEFTDMPATTVEWFGIFDAASAGTFLWSAPLDSSISTSAGDTARFDAGDANFTVT